MDEILSQEFSDFKFSEDDREKNYYLNLREFPNGEFEAVLKVVKPMKQDLMDAAINGTSYAAACAEKGETSRSGFPSFSTHRDQEEDQVQSRYDAQQNHARAVRRAKQNIRWLVKAMDADRLFTLTYRENQIDRDKARADFTRFLRLVRSGWRGTVGVPDWQYVAVLEKQDRGAYHIHCAVKGWQRIKFLRAAWYKALGGTGAEQGDQTPGAVNVTNPDRKKWGHTGRNWKVSKLAGYLTKYLSKTFDEAAKEKNRYWKSKDITKPQSERFWIAGATMPEAFKAAFHMLELHCGLDMDCFMWMSSSNDVAWIAGAGS